MVATIPTMLALQESSRLVKALRAEGVPVRTMVVNQVMGEAMSTKYLSMKLKEQVRPALCALPLCPFHEQLRAHSSQHLHASASHTVLNLARVPKHT